MNSQKTILKNLQKRFPWQENFLATAEEVSRDIVPYMESINATEEDYRLLERMLEPERVISFKVVWEDDAGNTQMNRGYRVQFNSARGPYKGGLRFDPSVNLDVLKFLALEQTFKNALTGLPLGSGKGGADFDPRDRSDAEIKRFCQAFVTELYRYIGEQTDVPAGDIGVSGREIGYMYGQYKRIANKHTGILTGKGPEFGGSCGRIEATGYGVVYLAEHVLQSIGESLEGKTAVVSGAGNVASHVAKKLIDKGTKVLTLSEKDGYAYTQNGITSEQLQTIIDGKDERKQLSEIVENIEGLEFVSDKKPWREVKADLYFPSATQNELDADDAKAIVDSGAVMLCEAANMPSTNDAVEALQKSEVIFVPAKAANAGGVAVSGLEMAQNAGHDAWTTDKVDERLQIIMKQIFETMRTYGEDKDGKIDYAKGANIGGFVKVFEAMKGLGW